MWEIGYIYKTHNNTGEVTVLWINDAKKETEDQKNPKISKLKLSLKRQIYSKTVVFYPKL